MNDKPKAAQSASAQETTVIKAAALFAGKREISIEFNGEVYRLRITRNDKLILTK